MEQSVKYFTGGLKPQLKFTPQTRPFSPQSKPYSPQSGSKSNPSNPSDNSSHLFTPKPRFSGENKGQSPISQPIYNNCKQSGHIISEHIALKRKREKERQESPKPTGLTSKSGDQKLLKDLC